MSKWWRMIALVVGVALAVGLCGWHPAVVAQAPPKIDAPRKGLWDLVEETNCASRRKDFQTALALVNRAIAEYPDSREVPYLKWRIGTLYHAMGDHQRAYSQWEAVTKAHPGTAQARGARLTLAQALIGDRDGDLGRAERILREHLADPATRADGVTGPPGTYSMLYLCYDRLRPTRREKQVLLLEEAMSAAQAVPKEDAQFWTLELGRWAKYLDGCRRMAGICPPVERMLGYLDLLQAGKEERAYAYLSDKLRAELSLEQFRQEVARCGMAGGVPASLDSPRQEEVVVNPAKGQGRSTTSVLLAVAGAKPGDAPRKLRFEWERDADKVWRLAKLPVEVPPDGK